MKHGSDLRGEAPDPASMPAHQVRRRERIVAAADRLLGAGDYESVQIRDVAAEAGIALGTLYRYFPSKELLYATVLRDWSARGMATELVIADDADAAGRLTARLHHSVDRFAAHPGHLRLQLQLQQSADEAVRAVYDEFTAAVLDSYAQVLTGLPADRRDDVLAIVSAVLIHQLGLFAQGRRTVAEVRGLLDRLVEMLLPAGD